MGAQWLHGAGARAPGMAGAGARAARPPGVINNFLSNTVGRPFTTRVPSVQGVPPREAGGLANPLLGTGQRGPGWGPREFSPGRTTLSAGLGAGGLGLGAYGLGHASRDAHYNPGYSATNPLTWFNSWGQGNANAGAPATADSIQSWQRNQQELQARQHEPGAPYLNLGGFLSGQGNLFARGPSIQQQLDTARQGGNNTEVERLQGRMERGDYGGDIGLWSMGGLNPLARPTTAYLRNNAMREQQSWQQHADRWDNPGPNANDQAAMTRIQRRLEQGNLLPQERDIWERQLEAVRQRVNAPVGDTAYTRGVRARMQGLGMDVRPPRAQGLGQVPGHWPLGPRPYGGNTAAQLWALNPADFMHDPSQYYVWNWSNQGLHNRQQPFGMNLRGGDGGGF
jgi:hypothetical protein